MGTVQLIYSIFALECIDFQCGSVPSSCLYFCSTAWRRQSNAYIYIGTAELEGWRVWGCDVVNREWNFDFGVLRGWDRRPAGLAGAKEACGGEEQQRRKRERCDESLES